MKIKITNADRYPNAVFLPQSNWEIIGTLNGITLFKIGAEYEETLVAKIGVDRVKDLGNISECQALELSSLAGHAAYGLILNK
jgi:hypothetical protein